MTKPNPNAKPRQYLRRRVTEAIEARGPCTVDAILDLFPDVERCRVQFTLNDLRRIGVLHIVAYGQWKGRAQGRTPATFDVVERGVGAKRTRTRMQVIDDDRREKLVAGSRLIASVFDLGGLS